MTETQLEFSDVLDRCIEDVKADRLTVEECLNRYPQFAVELRDPLMVAEMLRGMPKREPSETFRQQARPRLMSQLGPMTAGSVSLFEALRQRWTDFFIIPRPRRFSMAWMLALVLVASVLIGGGTAYASDAAVPGQPLYGLDRSLEEIQSSLTKDPEAYVAVQLAFADERLAEAQELANDVDSEEFQEALDGYGESIAAIAQEIESAEGLDLDALGTLLDEALSNQDAKLAMLSSSQDDNGVDDCNVNGEEECNENSATNDCVENSNLEDCDRNSNEESSTEDSTMVDGDKSDNSYCVSGELHPVALKLEGDKYTAEDIMEWFCGSGDLPVGFGFGQIMHAIQTEKLLAMGDSPLTAEELLALKASGMGWGQIWHENGLKGKPTVVDDTGDSLQEEDDLRPEPPGQAKKSDQQEPPGQAKKADQQVPPGQAKKSDGQVPPGQAKKADQQEPSDQAEESDQSTPSEEEENTENSESPGQAKKSDGQEPPGQAKKADQQAPPGQAKKSDQQGGNKGKNN